MPPHHRTSTVSIQAAQFRIDVFGGLLDVRVHEAAACELGAGFLGRAVEGEVGQRGERGVGADAAVEGFG